MFQTLLAASALANKASTFKPQPPKDFGLAKTFQEVQGNPKENPPLPDHKNLKQSFLIFSIIPAGIQKCIQKTGKASRTDLIKISLHP